MSTIGTVDARNRKRDRPTDLQTNIIPSKKRRTVLSNNEQTSSTSNINNDASKIAITTNTNNNNNKKRKTQNPLTSKNNNNNNSTNKTSKNTIPTKKRAPRFFTPSTTSTNTDNNNNIKRRKKNISSSSSSALAAMDRGSSISSMNSSSYSPSRSNSASLTPPTTTNNNNNTEETKDYKIYREDDELRRCYEQIKYVEEFMHSIKNGDGKCADYEQCSKRLTEKNEHSLREIESELIRTKQYINNKFECKMKMIENQYKDLMASAKEKLSAKYILKKEKEERLLKNELNKNERKKEKMAKKQQLLNNQNTNSNDFKFIIQRPTYRRVQMCDDNELLKNKNNTGNAEWPTFSNELMQNKWSAVSGIDNKQMENDVNQMVKNQDKNMDIRDILSLFPAKKVVYKSDKNILQIGDIEKKIQIRVGSYIMIRYRHQSKMIGVVKSISSKKLWAWMRQKDDKFAQSTLIEIPIQNIEHGNVKIKVIH